MGKKRGKHILMSPSTIAWPKVDKETEDKIITALTQKLQEFPSLESKRTKDARRKSGQPAPFPHPELSKDEEEKLKTRLRQQLVIGHRQVSKALEWNQLALVLASGDAQPPILLQSLLPLVASHRCPAICLSSLNPQVTDAIGVTSILAIGFKKSQTGEPNDFEEFVTMAASLAPPLSGLNLNQNTEGSGSAGDGDAVATGPTPSAENTAQKDESTAETPSSAKDCQLLEPDQEKELMEKLLELLKPYEPVLQKPRSKCTVGELQTRKNINTCMTMDLAAVKNAAHGGQLDLLLVQHERGDLHPILSSAVKLATEKACPVLYMKSLKDELGGIVRDNHLRVVGFKKSQAGTPGQPSEFQQFISVASEYIPTHPQTQTGSEPKDSPPGEGKGAESAASEKKPQPACPVYDVSSLYVYKKDDDNSVPDSGTDTQKDVSSTSETKDSSSASETFISLSSEPTVQYLGVKSLSDGTAVSDSAVIDTAGSNIPKKHPATEKPEEKAQADSPMETDKGAEFVGVMGLDSVDAPAISQPLYHESRGQKVKANLKRALDQSAECGGFVSFKIKPTNVQVSVPNPDKKKHKKFKTK